MTSARVVSLACVAFVTGLAVTARARDINVTDADRSFRNFTRDAATLTRGPTRIEVRASRLEDKPNPNLDLLGFPVSNNVKGVEGGIFDLVASYGLGGVGEVGVDMPFFIQKTHLGTGRNTNDADVGDLLLYTKFKRPLDAHWTAAGGVELTVPTGADGKGFGTGETALNPFASLRYQNGRIGIGAHIGYQVYTGSVDDVLNYSVTAIARGTKQYALRIEISGRNSRVSGANFDDVVILPGIDFDLTDALVIRPTGIVGLTGEAMDWGLGIGFVVRL